MKSNLIDIACELKHETEKAYLITDGVKDVWLPKSQCEYQCAGPNTSECITLPEWLAKDKGLI